MRIEGSERTAWAYKATLSTEVGELWMYRFDPNSAGQDAFWSITVPSSRLDKHGEPMEYGVLIEEDEKNELKMVCDCASALYRPWIECRHLRIVREAIQNRSSEK